MRVLVVTAVDAERAAIEHALDPTAPVTVRTVGVGPAEAGAGTAAALAEGGYDLVLGAGIGGGFAPLAIGDIAVASTIAFADLGAETPQGYAAASALGFGRDVYEVPAGLAVELADRTGGRLGTVLTVATVTGTAETALLRARRYPDAVAEGMEGAGVAAAAAALRLPMAELRAVSNAVGPRDRSAWDVPAALSALGTAVAAALADAGPSPGGMS